MSTLIVEVCMVNKIEKHPNADRLSIANVKGWNCIVGLNQYKAKDLVIYCPPDSVIPNDLIEKYNLEYLKKNGKVETVKLRGYISQGLILDIPEMKNWGEGKDVAKELGITKYEPPISQNLQRSGRQPTKKKRNPYFDKYTDIENIKNFNTVFKEGNLVVITEKIHGTNARYGNLPRYKDTIWGSIKSLLFGQYEFVYGSHNVQLTFRNKRKNFYGEDVYGQIAKKYNLAEVIPENCIIYGEIYGKKIQELEYNMEDIDVVFFDVKYKNIYLNYEDFKEFCRLRNFPTVPLLYMEKYNEKTLQACTGGYSTLNSNITKPQIREGCVVRAYKEENHPRIGRKVLKSVNPEYLLKKNRSEYH